MLGSEHVGPEVGASGGRYRGEDLGHAGADDECCRRQSRGEDERRVIILNMLMMIHPMAMTPGPPVFRP